MIRGIVETMTAIACFALAVPAWGQACRWELDPHDRYDGVIFPDSHATYWRIPLQIEPGKEPHFRIRGTMPKARYMGFMLYRTETGNAFSSISDEKIVTDPGPKEAPAAYTVTLLPRTAGTDAPNTFRYPKPHLSELSFELWYRIYLPDAGTNDEGGAPLPSVEAYAEDGTPIECPQVTRLRASSVGAAGEIPPLDLSGRIEFRRTAGRITSSNPDNGYAVARLPFTRQREVAVIRLRPPHVVRRGDPRGSDPSVRYWSICLSGIAGDTSACIADTEARRDADGAVTIVAGPESLESAVLARGFNFIPRGKLFFPILLYRTMLARSKPELPDGRLLSADYFRSEYPEVPVAGAKTGITHVAPPVVPARNEKTIRFGISRDLFLGAYWQQSHTRADRARSAHLRVPLWSIFADSVNKELQERTGFSIELSLMSSDTIAAALDRDALDFALVPGFQYTWIRRFYPRIEPIVHGVADAAPVAGTNRLHLLALPQTVERYGGEPGNMPLRNLRSARLAIYPARGEGLFALYQGLLAEGENPEGFFRLPLKFGENLDDAFDRITGNAIDRASGKIAACADVMLIDDFALDRVRKRSPGYARTFEILWTSPPVPLAMVLYSPLAGRRPMESRVREGLVAESPRREYGTAKPWSKPQTQFIEMALGRAFGIARFTMPNVDYMDTLKDFEDRMREFPEYLLPLSFFPSGSFEENGVSGRRGSNSLPSAWKADALPNELRPR